ncbi:hypothetical protein Taro_017855 [Colocasia esculenta]|uniref:Uncharacterized protein n=1 Tax=Colocasia esculenta TaxID=4460 RepID=A0A843UUI7_COLES|nr:hypothetical protein [Colocasia esculenta]
MLTTHTIGNARRTSRHHDHPTTNSCGSESLPGESRGIVNHTHENKKRKEVHAISRELQWYNQLVGHVGIHGQRRFTEALENRSLVYRLGTTGRELPNSQERAA